MIVNVTEIARGDILEIDGDPGVGVGDVDVLAREIDDGTMGPAKNSEAGGQG